MHVEGWLITCSASGIGGSAAQLVLERGDMLVATARDVSRLSELMGRFPDKVILYKLDVTDGAAAQQAVDVAVRTFGRLDVLLNNAG